MKTKPVKIHTIGFTKTSAPEFFDRLRNSGARRVVDVRLNNRSQLCGFSKEKDLEYFLREILDIAYLHRPLLAPTEDIFVRYRNKKTDWDLYARQFRALMRKREIEKRLDPAEINDSCLLCSEDKPHRCHRRLVAEYLSEHWGHVIINHL